jgi:hypothetical protein
VDCALAGESADRDNRVASKAEGSIFMSLLLVESNVVCKFYAERLTQPTNRDQCADACRSVGARMKPAALFSLDAG